MTIAYSVPAFKCTSEGNTNRVNVLAVSKSGSVVVFTSAMRWDATACPELDTQGSFFCDDGYPFTTGRNSTKTGISSTGFVWKQRSTELTNTPCG